jgi:uncharacterized protein DUF3237
MELRAFGTLTIDTDPEGLFILDKTSVGMRVIQEFLAVRFGGDRLRATMTGHSGADWLTVDDAGNATIDIRVLLLTDDGATVYVTMIGRASWPDALGRGTIYSMVRLESADERYAWVNTIPLVSKGAVTEGRTVAHEFFEMV